MNKFMKNYKKTRLTDWLIHRLGGYTFAEKYSTGKFPELTTTKPNIVDIQVEYNNLPKEVDDKTILDALATRIGKGILDKGYYKRDDFHSDDWKTIRVRVSVVDWGK